MIGPLKMIALVVIMAGGAWTWHVADRARAVREARIGWVQQVELDALRRTMAAQAQAAATHQTALTAAIAENGDLAAELEAYRNETSPPADCRVGSVTGRLRSN